MYFPESNILHIEDCLFYDDFHEDTGRWEGSGVDATYTSTGLILKSTTTSIGTFWYDNDFTQPIIIEYSSPDYQNIQVTMGDKQTDKLFCGVNSMKSKSNCMF